MRRTEMWQWFPTLGRAVTRIPLSPPIFGAHDAANVALYPKGGGGSMV